jgi:hypothetical protein
MRICLLLHDLSPSGGVQVALNGARALTGAGAEVEVLVTSRRGSVTDGDLELPVRALQEASGAYDVAVGTWWATAEALWQITARRRVLFLQSIENRFYREQEIFERLGAAAVLGLPVSYVVVAPWMKRVLGELRPDADCRVVLNGIDKETFQPAPSRSPGPNLRILVEGAPQLWFKGVFEAIEAVRSMRERAEVTVVALDPVRADELGVDRVVGALDAAGMARLYGEHDVLLKLSRVEGLALPPIEAFHVGLPCVTTPVTGHEEYVHHSHNGLVVGFDDVLGTAAALDLLARDRRLLGRLREGALRTASRWPDDETAGREFAAALIAACEPSEPAADAPAGRLLADLRLGIELGRRRAELAGWNEDEVRRLRELVIELSRSRDECAERLVEARGQLDSIRSSVPWRAAAAGRRAIGRLRS